MSRPVFSSSTYLHGRQAGLDRLGHFVTKAGADYAAHRNSDFGPHRPSAVSRLSPYLRYRLISEAEVITAVLDKHSYGTAEKFIQEVLWRTYWKGWLELRPEIWRRYETDVARLAPVHSGNDAFRAACEGRTGISGFDDWVHELLHTGYLHNHARMWFASIWIFTLKLPWALGADFFLRHLLDADAASNTLSWRWVGGLQTKGKVYLATTDNIARFTEGRFAPKGLALSAEPLSEISVPEPAPLRPLAPDDRAKKSVLLLHPDDVYAAWLIDGTRRFEHIYFLNDPSLHWSERAFEFVSLSMKELAPHIERELNAPVSILNGPHPDQMIDHIKSVDGQQIITPYAPVGQVASWMKQHKSFFEAAGLSLVMKRRDWDELFWPHATKGFFPFKEKIPALLRHIRLR